MVVTQGVQALVSRPGCATKAREVFAANLQEQPLGEEECELVSAAIVALSTTEAVLRCREIETQIEELTPGRRGHAPGAEREMLAELALLFQNATPARRIEILETARARG